MNATLAAAPETKGATDDYLDLKDAFGEFMTTFEAFKDSNDAKLAGCRRRPG